MSSWEQARRAIAGDAAELERLGALGRDQVAGERGGAAYLDELEREGLRRPGVEVLARPSTTVVLGTFDDVAAGFAVMTEVGTRAQVDVIFVEAPFRGLGVAERMIGLLSDTAVELEAQAIDATALPGDRATKNFFETFGLVARQIVVSRRLR